MDKKELIQFGARHHVADGISDGKNQAQTIRRQTIADNLCQRYFGSNCVFAAARTFTELSAPCAQEDNVRAQFGDMNLFDNLLATQKHVKN